MGPQVISSHGIDLVHPEYPSFSTRMINSLWPSDAMWRQRSGSTLAQVMVCCLTAPSHYLNQCYIWLIISEVQGHSYQGISQAMLLPSITKNPFENYISEISFKFPRGQCVKTLTCRPGRNLNPYFNHVMHVHWYQSGIPLQGDWDYTELDRMHEKYFTKY